MSYDLQLLTCQKKEKYWKEKQEKIAAAAKGCRSITDIFGRLDYLLYTETCLLIFHIAKQVL